MEDVVPAVSAENTAEISVLIGELDDDCVRGLMI